MQRSLFLSLSGALHMGFGAFFLFFNAAATRYMVKDPPASALLLVKGLGGIVIAFGWMNWAVRNEPASPALRAILVGTAVYLLFTITFDAWWTLQDLLLPTAWITVVLRIALVGGYVHFIKQLPQRS